MGESGSILIGVIVGFILMIVIGWIPVIGPLIAGFAAGYLTKGGLPGELLLV